MADGSGSGLSDLVARTAQANAKFYKGWMELSLEYFRGITDIFGGAAQSVPPIQEMDSGGGALVLEGEAGDMVRGSFLVSNDLDRPISCEFIASDFKDASGASVVAKVSFDPPTATLAAGEQRVVQVSIAVDDRLVAGVGHAGEIAIKGMDGFSVPVVLRRQHTIDDSEISNAPPDVGQPGGDTPKAAPASRAGGAKKKKATPKRARR